ncbi:hypothetical protein SPJ20_06870 [Ralstonia wenshanensis]|nr:hypothetical protein [Ralstonia wenshanensis]MDY7508039.1 hypothetical protein [Ralstonia wenshanensis]
MSLTKNRLYLDGAVSARAFLCRTRTDMRTHGQCRLGMLREQLTYFSEHAYPPAFVKGFVDAIDAYLSMSLGGATWTRARGRFWPLSNAGRCAPTSNK